MIKSLSPLYQAYQKKISLIFSRCGIYFKVFYALQLFLVNFYPFLQMYLQPHQKGWQLLTFKLFVLCSLFPCSPFFTSWFPFILPFSLSSFLFCHSSALNLHPPFAFRPFRPISLSLATMYQFGERLHYLVNYSLLCGFFPLLLRR